MDKLIKKLEEDKATFTKLRNKNSKGWQYDKFYYYQGKIEYINELIDFAKKH